MSDALTFKYQPEQNDYAQVVRIFFLKQTGIRFSLGLLGVAFIYILYVIATQTTPVSIMELVWLLAPPAFVAYMLIWQPRSVAKRAMSAERLAAEQTWLLDDAGLSIASAAPSWVENEEGEKVQTESKPTILAWENLKNLIVAKEYFILIFKTERNVPFFLPRRAISSTEEQDQFLSLVRSHLNH